MNDSRKRFGATGEDVAVEYLCGKGYRILQRNYQLAFGEIDVVAYRDDCVCFIEVKTRENKLYGDPFEAVDEHKQKTIRKMAECYLAFKNLEDHDVRFDVISVIRTANERFVIDHLEDAF